jgi:CheY-like chemotaxis protein
MAKFNIIVAEDDTVLRDLYLRKFDTSNYDIRTAANGAEALTLIKEKAPDLMLLDINMPVMDGFSVLEKIRNDKGTFPVIILTNFDDQVNRQRGEALKADDYFVKKDMTIKTLVEKVEKLLTAKKA